MAYTLKDMTDGRIVYDRKKHLFKYSDIFRIHRKIEDGIKPQDIVKGMETLVKLADDLQLCLGSSEFADYVGEELLKQIKEAWKAEYEAVKSFIKFIIPFLDDIVMAILAVQ